MPISTINTDVVRKWVDSEISMFMQHVIRAMNSVGLETIKYARDPSRPRYKDRTGNLTSSIGYCIVVDGKINSESNFQRVVNGDGGAMKGRSYMTDIAKQYNKGIVLVVVAGMDYAVMVEKRRDVLASARLQAETLVKQRIKEVISLWK